MLWSAEPARLARQTSIVLWQPAVLVAVLLAAAAAALAVDIPLGRWCVADRCPAFFHDLFEVIEPFGNGLGVVVIVLVIHQLDAARRWALPRLLACSLGAGLAADVVKLLVVRTRPYDFEFGGDVWASFGGWMPLFSAGSAGQSFPSAHTATAVGLAAALAWLYPHTRKLFVVLAVLVACQRIEAGAHYLSDVLCGGAVGCLVASACLQTGPLPRWFDRWESRWGRPPMRQDSGSARRAPSASRAA